MLMNILFNSSRQFILWVGRYDIHSTFFIATGRVATFEHGCSYVASAGMRWSDRHNRPAILPPRALPFTISCYQKKALCMPSNCGF